MNKEQIGKRRMVEKQRANWQEKDGREKRANWQEKSGKETKSKLARER